MAKAGGKYLLHRLVWDNNPEALTAELERQQHDLEEQDPHGRTPLRLAVILGHSACAKALLDCGADVLAKDEDGWTVTHEATATRDTELLRAVLEKRNFIQRAESEEKIPQLLQLLEESPDFYCEMRWDFSSWVPLVARLCPSDTYRIWKKGCCVRVDTTLLGYSNMQWQRGHRSFLFKPLRSGADTPNDFEMIQIDHDSKAAFAETIGVDPDAIGPPSRSELERRIDSAIVTTTMDRDKVGFERVRTGFWGFQSDKEEDIDGRTAKVFQASGIEIVTKTRVEHLPPGHSARKSGRSPMNRIVSSLGGGGGAEGGGQSEEGGSGFGRLLQSVEESDDGTDAEEVAAATAAAEVTEAEYFKPRQEGQSPVHIGKPKEVRRSKQTFKARVCVCEDFPLSLREQILPILDLLAPTSAHLSNLRDFVSLQLPSGFPIKVEIPVYHVLTARVTFGECHVEPVEDETVFAVPDGYRLLRPSAEGQMDREDAMLMLALQRSMQAQDMFDLDDQEYDAQMQQALMESLLSAGMDVPEGAVVGSEWDCELCTFHNAASAMAACSMCGTPRSASAGAASSGASAASASAGASARTVTTPARTVTTLPVVTNSQALDDLEAGDDAVLRRVLAMSLKDTGPAPDQEDEELRLALERSLAEK